jgi:hypothetical protein
MPCEQRGCDVIFSRRPSNGFDGWRHSKTLTVSAQGGKEGADFVLHCLGRGDGGHDFFA